MALLAVFSKYISVFVIKMMEKHEYHNLHKHLCTDPWRDPDFQNLLKSFNLWIDGVLIIIVSVFGLIGNLITIVIFNGKELRSTFHASLCVLAVFDLGYILVTLIDTVLQVVDNGGHPDPDIIPGIDK